MGWRVLRCAHGTLGGKDHRHGESDELLERHYLRERLEYFQKKIEMARAKYTPSKIFCKNPQIELWNSSC